MVDPVNLNRFRKQKARAAKKARADENVVKFSRSKATKIQEQSSRDKARRDLDNHKRDEP
ncbi:MAG: DUF4169 family protein [Pseudopelagicola sp.]|nr:DUF4169 family protein [Pseudopelagicola sp.]